MKIYKMKPRFVGVGRNESNEEVEVLNGKIAFQLVDSHGLPFDILILALETKDLAFDVSGFILAAKESKNYSKDKLRSMFYLEGQMPEECREKLEMILEKIYGRD